jgi:hypothetical protein
MHRSPVTRVVGSAASWFLFALALTLLCLAALWLSAEESCATGGPYVIGQECSADVGWLFPVGPIACLVAVVLGMIFAGGFGTQLVAWFWPLMFLSLGGVFLWATTYPGSTVVEVLCGIMLLLLGGLPLLLLRRYGLRPSVAGTEALDGTPFGTRPAGVQDWILSLGISVVASAAGVVTGRMDFLAL